MSRRKQATGMGLEEALQALSDRGGRITLVDGQPRLNAPLPLPQELMDALKGHREAIVEGLTLAATNPFVKAAVETLGASRVRMLTEAEHRRLFTAPELKGYSAKRYNSERTPAAAQHGGHHR